MNIMRKKLGKNGGFTLIEMLVVVGIIAILIAVSIPLISNALERSRDATDAANERAAKAEAILCYMGVGQINGTDFKGGPFGGVSGRTNTNFTGIVGATTSPEVVCYYDAVNGRIVTDAQRPMIAYGKCTGRNCTEEYGGTEAAPGNSNAVARDGTYTANTWNTGGHKEHILAVDVDAEGAVALAWVKPSTRAK